MTFEEYQKESKKTALYSQKGHQFIYPGLGLAGEAGEVAEHIKKMLRDDNAQVTPKRREEVKKELGDVLWYVSQLATDFKLSLEDIACENLKKIFSRQKRGKLLGDGDNR